LPGNAWSIFQVYRPGMLVVSGAVRLLLLSLLIKRITPETSRTLSSTGAVGLHSRFDSVRAASSASLLPTIPEWPGDHLNLRSIPARQSDAVLCAILANRAREHAVQPQNWRICRRLLVFSHAVVDQRGLLLAMGYPYLPKRCSETPISRDERRCQPPSQGTPGTRRDRPEHPTTGSAAGV